MHKEQLIREALSLPTNAIEYYVSQILADMYSQKALVEGGDGLFDIEEYAGAGHCTIEQKAIIYNQVVTYYQGQEMSLPGMKGHLKQDIHDDLQQFFASRALYEEYGVPWKRGILFVGPAGNGKTHAVKALINTLAQPCLYVKSFRAEHRTEEDNIRQVFDRKYPFDLPELAERLAYISMWNGSLKPALQLTEEGIARLGEITEGFSFAYLKELFLSSMMRWIAVEQEESIPETMQQVMETQVGALREQMMSVSTLEAEVPSEQSLLGMSDFMMGNLPGRPQGIVPTL